MLTAVKEVGKLIIEREGRQLLDILVEDPNSNGSYKKVITILFNQRDSEVEFVDVELEQYEDGKKMKYLYRSGAANSSDFSPTAKLSGKPEGTFDRKILGWFRILDDKTINLESQEKVFLEAIREHLEKNGDYIKNKILEIRENTPKKESILLTLKFNYDDEFKYVGDFAVFRNLLALKVKERDSKFMEKDRVCSICGEKKDFVMGRLDTYAFYTLDKPGFITGGFDESKSWRNFPVCSDCKLALEEGKKFIESNLNFKFCGIRYQLIPKFIMGEEEVTEDVMDIFTNTSRIVSLRQRTMKRITGDEEDILDAIKDVKDTITLNFLFIQKMNAAERILLVIEDVFPSRIRTIFDAKNYVDQIFDSNFTFGAIRNFFFKSDPKKRNSDLDGYFLDIIDKIFKGRPVSYHFILAFIMKKIRDEFVNDRYLNFAIRDGLTTVSFLEKLSLIKMEVDPMEQRPLDEFFAKYGPVFETPLKRGLFLLGSLTELLLRKQFRERSAKPFIKNLKSLKMNERDFKGLLPKIQNKLEEYDSFDKGKRKLAAEASNYLLLAGDKWKMSADELNFYFASGMNLTDEIAKMIYPEKALPKEVVQE